MAQAKMNNVAQADTSVAPLLKSLGLSTSKSDPNTVARQFWIIPVIVGAVMLGCGLFGTNVVVSYGGALLELVFLAYFARHLAFASAALSSGVPTIDAPVMASSFAPSVSVLVAAKNEETVVAQLIDSLLALDYPADKIEWIVVDDASTDATPALLDEPSRHNRRFRVLHRLPGAGGGKSGALNDALAISTGEIIIIFDADHRPRPDVVRRLVRHFSDSSVGAVQGRCRITNAADSPLAEMVAIDYLGGYLVNEYGRQAVFGLPAYGGANCAVRADWLRTLGGWNPESVTEDTDLTLRLALAGARVRYDVTAVDEEEGVVTFRRFWRQRYRWARGHQQCWRDYRRAVWRSPNMRPIEKLETTMFLFGYHLPVLAMLGAVMLVFWFAGIVAPAGSSWMFVYTSLLFLGPLVELGGGLVISRSDRRLANGLVWFLPLFFVSMAVCSVAWFEGVTGRSYTWVKTSRRADQPTVTPTTQPALGPAS